MSMNTLRLKAPSAPQAIYRKPRKPRKPEFKYKLELFAVLGGGAYAAILFAAFALMLLLEMAFGGVR